MEAPPMYGIKYDRTNERDRIYWILPSRRERFQNGLTVKEIYEKIKIEQKIISGCLQTLKKHGFAERHSGNRWRQTNKSYLKSIL